MVISHSYVKLPEGKKIVILVGGFKHEFYFPY